VKAGTFGDYAQRDTTRREHQAEAYKALGLRPFTRADVRTMLGIGTGIALALLKEVDDLANSWHGDCFLVTGRPPRAGYILCTDCPLRQAEGSKRRALMICSMPIVRRVGAITAARPRKPCRARYCATASVANINGHPISLAVKIPWRIGSAPASGPPGQSASSMSSPESALARCRTSIRVLPAGHAALTCVEPTHVVRPLELSEGDTPMKREQLTEKILDIKRENGWTWKQIADEIGGMSPVLVVGALLGQMKLVKPLARKAAGLFGLSSAEERMLNEVPNRGTPMPPTDPLIYRFYELVMVNGPAWKALIEEEFGDGIMSAIDFDMEIERLPNPKGDRVKITMSGKFLPYKYYGNEQGILEYGVKET
jgi:cyanate lyase